MAAGNKDLFSCTFDVYLFPLFSWGLLGRKKDNCQTEKTLCQAAQRWHSHPHVWRKRTFFSSPCYFICWIKERERETLRHIFFLRRPSWDLYFPFWSWSIARKRWDKSQRVPSLTVVFKTSIFQPWKYHGRKHMSWTCFSKWWGRGAETAECFPGSSFCKHLQKDI